MMGLRYVPSPLSATQTFDTPWENKAATQAKARTIAARIDLILFSVIPFYRSRLLRGFAFPREPAPFVSRSGDHASHVRPRPCHAPGSLCRSRGAARPVA